MATSKDSMKSGAADCESGDGFWADRTGLIKAMMKGKDAAEYPGAKAVFVVLVAADILKSALASRAFVEPSLSAATGSGQHIRFAYSEICGEVAGWLVNFDKDAVPAKKSKKTKP